MKNMKLAAKIGVVTTSLLMGIFICGTVIANENVNQISKFLGQSRFDVIHKETDGQPVDKEYFKSEYENIKSLLTAGEEAVKTIEGEGATLIKNENNALPLAKGTKVSLLGFNSYDPSYGGRGSAQMGASSKPAVTPNKGLTDAGLKVNQAPLEFYAAPENVERFKPVKGSDLKDASWADHESLLKSIEEYGEAVFYTIDRTGGEGQDLPPEHLHLSANEESVIKGLKALKDDGKIQKIVILLNLANPIDFGFIDDPDFGIDAALWVGNPGIAGYAAVGEILVGDINPSGHLPDTFWKDINYNPVQTGFTYNTRDNMYNAKTYTDFGYNVPNDRKFSNYTVYTEGIYVGYRYTETRYADVVANRDKVGAYDYNNVVLRPFGYGESYTKFAYENLAVEAKEDKDEKYYTISVDVHNVGTVAGKDAVQIYAQKPYTEYDIAHGIEKSAVDLVGYSKTNIIKPGETEKVTINVDERSLASYDANEAKTYIIDKGDYYFTAAHNSHNAINNILKAQGHDNIVGEGDKNLASKVSLEFDATTYSTTKNTGVEITNLFDEADINKSSVRGNNKVTYLSRNDWEGTFPTELPKLSFNQKMAQAILKQESAKTVKEDKDSTYPKMGNNIGLQLASLMKDNDGKPLPYDDPMWEQYLDQFTWDELVKITSDGFRMTAGVASVGKPQTTDANGPAGLTSAYEASDGLANRVNDPDKGETGPYYPCAGIISATFSHETQSLFGHMLGNDAVWAGYAGLYGIGLNTHRAPIGGRTFEYFSEDPYLGGMTAANEVKELEKHGCHAYIKHFAFNDTETNRTGLGIWFNEQSAREIYLKQFQIAVEDGGAYHAMTAFNRIGVKFAPASHELVTDFLKEEVGLKGLVVTDMFTGNYQIQNWPNFLMAGCDIPDGALSGNKPVEMFKPGKGNYGHVARRMRDAAHRICYATVHSNAMNGIDANTILVEKLTPWEIGLYTADGIISTLFAGAVAFAIYLGVKSLKK